MKKYFLSAGFLLFCGMVAAGLGELTVVANALGRSSLVIF